MRFYVKLILFVGAFLALSRAPAGDAASDLGYALRVKYVQVFGSERDFEALVDDTQRALAARAGRPEVYQAGKRFHALLEERLADAAGRNIRLTDHELDVLRAQCTREAFQGLVETPPTGQCS